MPVTLLGRRGVLALFAPAMGVLFATACAPAPQHSSPNVVLICLDTVRADRRGAYGYTRHPTTPALDRLAARSTVFLDTSATAGWTKPSVPSFFTGTFPAQHGVYEGSARLRLGAVTDVLAEAAVTLAEVFQANGYRTGAFIRNVQLRPGNGFEQGFDLYREEAEDATEITDHGISWLNSLEKGSPFFLYLHFLDAHWPYPVPDEYASRFAEAEPVARLRSDEGERLIDAVNDGEETLSPEERLALEGLYDGSIRYIDDQLGRLFDELATLGIDENTVIAVISDHGEEFGEHGRVGHGHGLYENLLRVPWILALPDGEFSRVTTPVSLVDLFPTLLASAGLEAPETSEGVDRLARPTDVRPIFAEHKDPDRYQHPLRQDRFKLVRRFEPPDLGERSPLEIGERWEAELERLADGRLRAVQLKLRDEDPDDPIEVKGLVGKLRDSAFDLGGFRVNFGPETRIQLAEGALDSRLVDGLPVKVKGTFLDDGFQAERIKIYAPDTDVSFEIRGPVGFLDSDGKRGKLTIGGVVLHYDEQTRFKGVDGGGRKRMARMQVSLLLELGAEAAGEAGFTTESRLYDLDLEPAEQDIAPSDVERDTLGRRLDRMTKYLVARQIFGADDRKVLDDETIRKLRALGYAD